MDFYQHKASDFAYGVKLHQLPMVYAISTSNLDYVKIGVTKSFKQRFSNIQTACPLKLFLWHGIRSPKANEIEHTLHELFCVWNVRGEWFNFSSEALDDVCNFFDLTNKNVREVSRALL
jgi:T5orf172 domain